MHVRHFKHLLWASDRKESLTQVPKISQSKVSTLDKYGGKVHHLLMAYSLSNISTKNYLKQTTTVKIIVGSWVVYFSETQCIYVNFIKKDIKGHYALSAETWLRRLQAMPKRPFTLCADTCRHAHHDNIHTMHVYVDPLCTVNGIIVFSEFYYSGHAPYPHRYMHSHATVV